MAARRCQGDTQPTAGAGAANAPASRPLSSAERAALCAHLADEKKATDILIIDLREQSYITDFFVICTGGNDRQRAAIGRDVIEQMKRLGEKPLGAAGERGAPWVLVDFGDIVLHVFSPEMRRLYDLELLWGDAPRLSWNGGDKPR